MANSLKSAPTENGADGARNGDRVTGRGQSLRLTSTERRKFERAGGWGRSIRRVVALAVLGAAAWFGFQSYESYRMSQPVECDAVAVTYDTDDGVMLSLAGYLLPTRRVVVSPRVAGTIVELPIEVGTVLREGDVLATLDETTYRAEFDQAQAALELAESKLAELENGALDEEIADAEAQLDQAKAMLELRTKERERNEILRQRNTLSRAEWELCEAEYKQSEARVRSLTQTLTLIRKGPREERIRAAQAEVARARAAVAQARYFLDNTKILAPINGTVLEKNTEAGETVRPDVLLTSMFTMADLTELEAEVDLQERDLHRVRIGQKCRIIPDAYPESSFEGTILRFQPQVNRQRGVVEVRIKVANPDQRLLPQMNCRVEFLHDGGTESEKRLLVPVEAVLQESTGPVAYVVRGDVAERRPLELGESLDDLVEVRRGLAQGEVVLLPGESQLAAGQRVAPRLK